MYGVKKGGAYINTNENIRGIIRKTDKLGRVVTPVEYRKLLNWGHLEDLEVLLVADGVLIRKPLSLCKLCGQNSDLLMFKSNLICLKCINQIKMKSF